MSTHIGIGFSKNIDNAQAAREAAIQAKTNLQAPRIDIAIVLSTIHYNPVETVPAIRDLLTGTKLIGCSTTGIILSSSIETRGIAVLAITSEDMRFGIGAVENIGALGTPQIGMELAQNCLNDFGRHGRHVFIFFVDSRLKDLSPLLKGTQGVLGNIFPIIGAGTCDDFHFGDTFQIFQDKPLQNSAAGIIIGGHMSVGVGNHHGWQPLGKPRTIDKAERNIIKTIDSKRAYGLYEEYFGEESRGLRAHQLGQMALLYPLGILIEGNNGYLLRNAIDIREDGSIVCQGDIPEGAQVHIMIGNKDSCKQAAQEAAQEARQNLLGKQPKLVIVIESMVRLKLLGRSAFQEILKIREIFGPKTPIIGMYANGEICPLQSIEKFKRPHVQNESIIVLAIS